MHLYNPLNPIMVIKRVKLIGPGEHWGVQLPDGQVAHYTAERDLEVVPFRDFAKGKEVKVVRTVPHHLSHEVFYRLNEAARVRRRYHATDWNCETFANWLTGEAPASQQVIALAVLTLVSSLLWLGART